MKYIEAVGRNVAEMEGHSHLYTIDTNGLPELPMCRYGWNRSDGERFSILRGWRGGRGLCRICERRAEAGLPGVECKPGSHKTKWI